jgi:hypothetical protein
VLCEAWYRAVATADEMRRSLLSRSVPAVDAELIDQTETRRDAGLRRRNKPRSSSVSSGRDADLKNATVRLHDHRREATERHAGLKPGQTENLADLIDTNPGEVVANDLGW